jgi:hypothetical protein
MPLIKIAKPAAAESAAPNLLSDLNRANRVQYVTPEEYAAIATSGVLADEIVDASLLIGTAAERAAITGIYECANVAVTVPAITDPDIASVDVDVSAAFTTSITVGSAVIAVPQEAMETNCRIQNAYVTATDTIRVVFGSLGGNVTGGAKNFTFVVLTLGTPA